MFNRALITPDFKSYSRNAWESLWKLRVRWTKKSFLEQFQIYNSHFQEHWRTPFLVMFIFKQT